MSDDMFGDDFETARLIHPMTDYLPSARRRPPDTAISCFVPPTFENVFVVDADVIFSRDLFYLFCLYRRNPREISSYTNN